MVRNDHPEITKLYDRYNEILKPLLAEVESTLQELPLVLLNEIRMFNDHIARCYRPDGTSEFIADNIERANGHLKRVIFDCFKHLNVYYHDTLSAFEHHCRNIDLTTINNGEFYIRFKKLRQNAVCAVKEAKRLETLNQEQAFDQYQDAYNTFVDLDDLVTENLSNINWAKHKFTIRRFVKICAWLATAVVSGVVSSYFTQITDAIKSFFSGIFGR